MPGEAYPHPSWLHVRAEALAALARGQSVAVLGRAGSGKSLLLHDVAQNLRRQGRSVASVDRAEALTGPIAGDVVVVDEAGLMPLSALRRLCGEGRPVVLAALPEFAPSLASLPGPVVTLTLDPLAPEDVARFVLGRLAAAGRRRDLFEPAAILAVAVHSGGMPRLINVLAGSALFLAEQEGAGPAAEHADQQQLGTVRVTRRHVDEAAAIRAVLIDEEAAQPAPAAEARAPAPAPASVDPPPVAAEVEPRQGRAPTSRRRSAAVFVVAAALGAALIGTLAGPRPAPTPRTAPGPVPSPAPNPAPASLPPQGAAEPAPPPVAPAPAPAPASPIPASPPPASPLPAAAGALSFHGPVTNETMHQSGQLAVTVRRTGASDAVVIQFHAYAGLVGSGELNGTVGGDGRILAAGRLMMGSNPFDCTLKATLLGDTLAGSATFTRTSTGATALSSFTLTRH